PESIAWSLDKGLTVPIPTFPLAATCSDSGAGDPIVTDPVTLPGSVLKLPAFKVQAVTANGRHAARPDAATKVSTAWSGVLPRLSLSPLDWITPLASSRMSAGTLVLIESRPVMASPVFLIIRSRTEPAGAAGGGRRAGGRPGSSTRTERRAARRPPA